MTTPTDPDPLRDLRTGGKRALALALAQVEAAPEETSTLDLLDAAYRGARAHVVGITGPPGVGKSTLISRLIAAYREHGTTIGAIAVDPSSRRSGGALLADRTRFAVDPEDPNTFVRSMASRGRLGGLADLTPAATVLMRAVFDLVIVETVGVGQAETEVTAVADTVALAVQPGSGDSLQYLKAGIAEIPDVAVVTKADLGDLAHQAAADVRNALECQAARTDGWSVPVIEVSALEGRGIDRLIVALGEHLATLRTGGRLEARRRAQAEGWLAEALRAEYGRHGLTHASRLPGGLGLAPGQVPFRRLHQLVQELRRDGIAGSDRRLKS